MQPRKKSQTQEPKFTFSYSTVRMLRPIDKNTSPARYLPKHHMTFISRARRDSTLAFLRTSFVIRKAF